MGRGVALTQVPVEHIATLFYLDANHELRHRQRKGDAHFNSTFGDKVAGFDCVGTRVVRLQWGGKTRRFMVERVKAAVATGAWPKGNYRGNPKGGRDTSLDRRQASDDALIAALIELPGASLTQLQTLVGGSRGNICERLYRFADKGWAEGPKCCPTRHWAVTEAGRARGDEADLIAPHHLNGHAVPWLRYDAIAAASSKDVIARGHLGGGEQSLAQRSLNGRKARRRAGWNVYPKRRRSALLPALD
jgi:hypothetical protein